MAADVGTTMDTLIACVVDSLAAIDRPVCDSGTTIGPPEIGPDACCKCRGGGGSDGEVIGFLERVYPVNGPDFEQVIPANCRRTPIAADIVLTVVRCFPRIDAKGNMPKLDQTSVAADNLNLDFAAVWNAVECCGENLGIREAAVDSDPEGGCSAFAIRVTTLVSMPAPEAVGS